MIYSFTLRNDSDKTIFVEVREFYSLKQLKSWTIRPKEEIKYKFDNSKKLELYTRWGDDRYKDSVNLDKLHALNVNLFFTGKYVVAK